MNGKSPSSGAPIALEDRGAPVEDVLDATTSAGTGTASSSAIVRGSCRSCDSTRAAVAAGAARAHRRSRLDRARRNAVVEVVRAGARAQLRRRRRGEQRPSRISSSSSQRSASSITWLETSSVVPPSASSWNSRPELARGAPDRARPSARRGRAARARRAARWRATRAPAGRRTGADDPVREPLEADRLQHLVDPARADAERRARSSAGSRARSGRRRPTAPASRSRRGGAAPASPRGAPSTVTVPPATICTPTIARISVVLPEPLGPRRPAIRPGRARARRRRAPGARRGGRTGREPSARA